MFSKVWRTVTRVTHSRSQQCDGTDVKKRDKMRPAGRHLRDCLLQCPLDQETAGKPERGKIAVKVIDAFGGDGMTIVEVTI